MPSIVLERGLFIRERNDGLYRPITYLCSKVTILEILTILGDPAPCHMRPAWRQVGCRKLHSLSELHIRMMRDFIMPQVVAPQCFLTWLSWGGEGGRPRWR